MTNKEIILIGYSGHGFVVAEAAIRQGLNLQYYTEVEEKERNPFHLRYFGNEQEENFHGWNANFSYILGIGDNNARSKVLDLILKNKKEILNVIHPSALFSETANSGYGNFLSKNVIVNPLVKIGNACILNTGCIIEHECEIGNAVHIAPGAVLAGNVRVGDFSFIGANAVVKQGVTIGHNAVIGAGTVVLNDVKDGQVIIGNPGREL